MPDTSDFDSDLLDKENVVGVSYEDGVVEVLVTEKKPLTELRAQDVISQNVPDGQKTDVHEAGGEITPELLDPENPPIEAFSNRHTRHRPVREGVSEIHADSSAATSGHYPVRITDPKKGIWSGVLSEGDLVRLSNCHSYAQSGQADLGDTVLQPSPHDGGDQDDISGSLCGYLPLRDGVTADVAARTATRDTDTDVPHDLDTSWPTGIRRSRVEKGEVLTKTGRTTGVTEGEVRMTNASVNVSYPHGTVRLTDQILTSDMSQGGDSGSSVFDADGNLVGLLFAGSSQVTVHNRVANVEDDFGVEYLTAEPSGDDTGNGDDSGGGSGDGSDDSGGTDDNDDTDMPTEKNFEDYLQTLLETEYGDANVARQWYFSTGRIADFVVFDHDREQVRCYELENDASSAVAGAGQVLFYTANATHDIQTEGTDLRAALADMGVDPDQWTSTGVLCYPADRVNDDERPLFDYMGIDLREEDLPEGVSVEGV